MMELSSQATQFVNIKLAVAVVASPRYCVV